MDEEKKNGVSRGVVSGMLGAIVIMVIFMLMISFNYGILGKSDDTEKYQALMTFDNECNYTLNVTVYVMGVNEWDVIYFTIHNMEQNAVMITWKDDLHEVLVIYNILDENRAYRYNIEPNENRIVMLI